MKETMMDYCVGFLFSEDHEKMVLIEKQKPDWQKGKLNGIGGKIEDGEDKAGAMVREFQEETGVCIPIGMWQNFCDLNLEGGGIVHCFRAFSDVGYNSARTIESEQVKKFFVYQLPGLVTINNLKWLIPLALDSNRIFSTVRYSPGQGFK